MKWINPSTGQLERRPPGLLHSVLEDYNPFDPQVQEHAGNLLDKQRSRMPASLRRLLDLSKKTSWDGEAMKASSVAWRDMLTPRRVLVADGAQILNTVTNTIMCPDFTFAADYLEAGDCLKYTLLFDVSTIAGAQTQTYILKWGGQGGVALATSGAFQADTTAISTTQSQMLEYYMVCRATGTAGSSFTMGRLIANDYDDASLAAVQANLNMLMVPTNAPAAVAIDTTIAKALSPTITFSTATATVQLTNHIALLESLN